MVNERLNSIKYFMEFFFVKLLLDSYHATDILGSKQFNLDVPNAMVLFSSRSVSCSSNFCNCSLSFSSCFFFLSALTFSDTDPRLAALFKSYNDKRKNAKINLIFQKINKKKKSRKTRHRNGCSRDRLAIDDKYEFVHKKQI